METTRQEQRSDSSIQAPPPKGARPDAAAYGGPGWRPRTRPLSREIGEIWGACGIDSEWAPLRAIVLHRPGAEFEGLEDPDATLMLERPDPERVVAQHDAMADAYRTHGVEVHYVDPPVSPPPNQIFCADLMFMTPSGVIVGRPASTVRAGEERWLARRLADLGVPILRSVAGTATFEGADACWLDPGTVLVGRGLRTNLEGACRVAATLTELGVDVIQVDLPHASMHLMGEIRIVDEDLAFCRPNRTPWAAVQALEERGYEVRFFPDEEECRTGMGHNFVVLGPRKILVPAGNPRSIHAYEEAGVECVTVEMDELVKAAGAVGCLTGVVERDRIEA